MYELKEPKIVCKISFRTRPDSEGYSHPSNPYIRLAPDCPTDYTFEGSNSTQFNESSVLLLNVTLPCFAGYVHPVTKSFINSKPFTQSFINSKPFKYYRLNVLDVQGWPDKKQKYAVISDVRFYGREKDCW